MKKRLLPLLVISCVLGAIGAEAQVNYEPCWFATLAGLTGSFGSVDGIGRGARFFGLVGVAVDGVGNIYVADKQNYIVRKVSPAGEVTTVINGSGQIEEPWGLAVD